MNENRQNPAEHDPLEEYINGTLRHDADSVRSRLGTNSGTVPNERLTAKLALQTASRGMFSSFGSKFALYLGATTVVAAIVYFRPQSSPNVAPPIKQDSSTVLHSSIPAQRSQNTVVATHKNNVPLAPKEPSVFTTAPVLTKPTPHPALKLDEGTNGKIPVYTDSNYKGPLK